MARFAWRTGAARVAIRAGLLAALALVGTLRATDPARAESRPPAGPAPAPRVAAVRAAIERSNATALEALKKGDAKAYAARFEPQGELLQVSGKIVRGRAAIEQWFANQVTELGRVREGEIRTRDVFVLGSIAYETGRHALTFEQRGVPSATLEGRYVAVWRRSPKRGWQVLRSIEVPKD